MKNSTFVALMKNSWQFFGLVLIIMIAGSCKSTYEVVRTSNDPELIMKTANEYYEKEDYFKAQSLYELVIPFYRGKKEAEDLFYKYAYTYYNSGQYILAAHYFRNFSKTFYNSPKREEVSYLSAYSNYLMSPNYKLDQGPTETAIEELQSFINSFPNSPRVDECNSLIDEMRMKLETKAFESAKLYYDLGNFQSAVVSFDNLIKDFPETERKEEIRFLSIKSGHELARNSIYEKKEERLESEIEKCNKYIDRYPESDRIEEVQDILAYCKNEIKRFEQ